MGPSLPSLLTTSRPNRAPRLTSSLSRSQVPTQQFLRSSQSVHSASSPPSLHGATLGVPAGASPSSSTSSLARYNLGADEFSLYHDDSVEADDDFHDPGPKLERVGPDHRLVEPKNSRSDGVFGIGFLGLLNLIAIFVIATALVGVFAGWPIYNWATSLTPERFGAAGIGGTNGSGQVPDLPNFRGLIDKDTPQAALTRTMDDGTELQLVFSDEFNQDGRLFYPGMDPYWEAVEYVPLSLLFVSLSASARADAYLAASGTGRRRTSSGVRPPLPPASASLSSS